MATVLHGSALSVVDNGTVPPEQSVSGQTESLLSGYLSTSVGLQLAATLLFILMAYDQSTYHNLRDGKRDC